MPPAVMRSPDAPVDLHTHTTASDGSCTPAELVEMAHRKGIAAVAVTDHDTVAGIEEARRASTSFGVEVVPGIEISAEHSPGVMHILGYFVEVTHEALRLALAWVQARRRERNPQILSRLHSLGIPLSQEEVQACAGGGQIGRPHIAEALVRRGVVTSVQEAFDRYLKAGGPAYVPKQKLSPERAIEVIRAAGGVPVLAHPYQMLLGDGDALAERVRTLVDMGLEGIECYYTYHTPEQTACYLALAERFGLAVTGGSDFHGDTKPNVPLGLREKAPEVSYRLVDQLRRRASSVRGVPSG